MARTDPRNADDWVRAGILSREQAVAIERVSRVDPLASTWPDVVIAVGGTALALALGGFIVFFRADVRSGAAANLWAVTCAAFGALTLSLFLRSYYRRASEAALLLTLAVWADLAFMDPTPRFWTVAPAFVLVWSMVLVDLRPETRFVGALLQWPVTVLALAPLQLGDGNLVSFTLAALYLGLTALALPRTGPWRQVPRAALVAIGLGVAVGSMAFMAGGFSFGRLAFVGVGLVLAGGAWVLLARGSRLAEYRLPAISGLPVLRF